MCPELKKLGEGNVIDYQNLYRAFCRYCDGVTGPLELCGLSLGAVLALHYCLDHPERVGSLVLIAGQYKMPKRLLKLQNLIFRLMPLSAFADMGMEKAEMVALSNSMMELDFSKRLGEVPCPVLVLCGERDKANRRTAVKLAKGLPQGRLRFIPGSGHEVNVDAPEALAAELERFYRHGEDFSCALRSDSV